MTIFNLTKTPSRNKILEAAERARVRGRLRRAIAGYKRLLKNSPEDHLVHLKLAPLLARARRFEESWLSFEAACRGFLDAGFREKALGVYMQAARYMPKRVEVWQRISELQLERGLKADAVETLIKGHKYLRGRRTRPKAIELLKKALEIAPKDHDIAVKLAGLLSKENKKDEALGVLYSLVPFECGKKLRNTRWTIFKISPSLKNLFLFLRTTLKGG